MFTIHETPSELMHLFSSVTSIGIQPYGHAIIYVL